MEIIVDSKITLKQISLEYLNELYSLVESNKDKDLLYWCPDLAETYKTLESTEFHIKDANSKYNEDGTPDFLIFENDNIAGLISLSPLFDNGETSEIGYWLGASFEGRGIISKAFPQILKYAKKKLKLQKVHLSTSVPNVRSQKLPKKFKFEEIKRIKNVEVLKTGSVDHILWELEL